MNREGIALAGNLILDYYKEIDLYPAHSTLATIRRVSRETGGLVCNCAQAITMVDPTLPITVIGRIGEDEAGRVIQKRLGRFSNINLDRLVISGETSFTDAMIDLQNKTRTYFQFRGANALLGPEDFRLESLNAKILHVGYILLLDRLDQSDAEYGTVLARLLSDAQKAGIKTSIDIVSEASDRFDKIVPASLKYVDYAIINEYEAAQTTGINVRDIQGNFKSSQAFKICDKLMEMGVTTWAVVHSREGAVGVSSFGDRVALPALDIPRTKIISTIGAGDAFLSGCLYQAYKGQSLEVAIKTGIAAATTSLLNFNATDGIQSNENLKSYYDETTKEIWPEF